MGFNNLKINMKIINIKWKIIKVQFKIHTLKYTRYFKVKYLMRIFLIYAK